MVNSNFDATVYRFGDIATQGLDFAKFRVTVLYMYKVQNHPSVASSQMSADLHGSTPRDVEFAEKIVTSWPDATVIFAMSFRG